MTKRWIAFALILVVAMSVFAGGGKETPAQSAEASGKRVLTIAGHTRMYPGEEEVWDAMAKAFMEENPDVQVVIKWQGTIEDTAQNLQAAKLAGETIDLYSCGTRVIRNSLAPAGIVTDMTELIKPYEDRFAPGMLEGCMVGGRVWAFPIGSGGSTTFYYNKQMFEDLGLSVPATYDELVEICNTIRSELGITPILQQGTLAIYWPMWYFETYEQATGNKSVENVYEFLAGERQFTGPEEVEAFNLIKRFFDDGLIDSDSLNTNADGMRAAFSQGKSAMFFGGTWEYTNIMQVVGDSFEVGVFEFPIMVPGSQSRHGTGSGGGWFIPSFCNPENFDIIMKFVEFMTRPEWAGQVIETCAPIIPSVVGVSAGDSEFITTINENHAKHSIAYLDWIWPAEVNDVVARNIPAVGTGYMTAEQACAEIQSTYDRVVDYGYDYDWWESWSEAQWEEVTPEFIPESYAD